jgi:hypothetical protein
MFQTGVFHETHNRKNEAGEPLASFDLPAIKMVSDKHGDTLIVLGLGIAEKGTSHSQASAIVKNVQIGADAGEWTPDADAPTEFSAEERDHISGWIGKAESRLNNLETGQAHMLEPVDRRIESVEAGLAEHRIHQDDTDKRLAKLESKPANAPVSAPATKPDPPKK